MSDRVPYREFDVSLPYKDKQLSKVAKANKRLRKLDLPEFETEVDEPYLHEFTIVDSDGHERKVAEWRVAIRVYGESPCKEGWTFAATLEWLDSENVVVRKNPNVLRELPRPGKQECEHCRTRRHRNDTYLVLSDEGDVKQVGRQCLQSYTGIPVGWVQEFERGISRVEEESPKVHAVDLEYILQVTAADVKVRPYRSKAQMDKYRGDYATYYRVVDFVWDAGDMPAPYWKKSREGIKQHLDETTLAEAREAIEWVKSIDDDSEYFQNLKSIVRVGFVGRRATGLAVSIFGAWLRSKMETKEVEELKPVPTGQGVVIEGEVQSLDWRESEYGWQLKWLVHGDGYRVWGSVPSKLLKVEKGARVRFVANVDASKDDESFGFAKRPRQSEVLEAMR